MILKVNASGYSEKMKDAYDHYLEEDLPKMGWSRSHAGHYGSEVLAFVHRANLTDDAALLDWCAQCVTLHPLLQAYQEGLRRFQESYERMVELNNGTEVRPLGQSLAIC